MASALSFEKLLTGDAKFSQKYLDSIRKVTPLEIQDMAKKYFAPEKMTVSELSPKSYVAQDEKQKDTSFAQTLPWKSKILKNGIKLIAIQNTLTPTASVTVAFKGGLLAETPKNNGLSKIAAEMLIRSKKNDEELTSLFENRGASISAFFDDNSFGIHAKVLKDDFSFALKTMSDTLRTPPFPLSELKKVKNLCLLDIKADNDSMFRRGFLDLKKALYQDHPYAMRSNGTEQSILSITQKDLTNFYKKFGQPSNMVIACCGDINPDEAIKILEDAFSSLKDSLQKDPLIPQGVPPLLSQKNLTINLDRQGAVVFFGFQGTTLTGDEVFAFDILSGIMSGSSGRLLHSIRNQDNLSYTQHFFSRPSYDQGLFGIYAATSPEKQEHLSEMIKNQLKILVENGVTDKEIEDAKAELITRSRINRQSNDFLSSQLAGALLYGINADRIINYEKFINDITVDRITDIINKYIKNASYVTILVTPAAQPSK
jgi:zinc protease